ncbi:DUF899 family protein [Duganella sp. HH101]|uniref:DUF899 family protein n=1 Tax=Duganella sp. HH101 TaxID=1781066 RepID=UPI0008738747|nr:DUF899 family protein [Duganella sp. HH101]OFA04295.1 hypothetical protein DUGA2_25690 [Duganella sp. HH101]
MATLTPAAELAARSTPYPNDSAAYRAARTALLAEEIELRRHIERVAAQRRALPLGGEAPDYSFIDENGETVKLAELFGRHDTLVTYFWMYGPQRERPCPMCTAFLGAIDIPSRDLSQRVAVAVLGRSPVSRQLAFARERGWRNLAFYQCVGDDYPRDYRGLAPDGSEWPALDVWVKRDGKVHHFWASELGGTEDPGQDPRGAPDPTPLWNILDLTPAGRGADWYPKLSY